MAEAKNKTPEGKNKTPAKKRRYSPLVEGDNLKVNKGDNAKYLSNALSIFQLPPIDLFDPEQVQNRLEEYFRMEIGNDMKPTVTGLAMALGVSRDELWKIRTGNWGDGRTGKLGGLAGLPKEVVDTVKKAYDILTRLWEDYMQNGKINPMAGIFLGVNNYGMKNTKDVVIETTQENGSERSESELIKSAGLLPSDLDSEKE